MTEMAVTVLARIRKGMAEATALEASTLPFQATATEVPRLLGAVGGTSSTGRPVPISALSAIVLASTSALSRGLRTRVRSLIRPWVSTQ
jgi:hypothetical protein